jgi:TonB family protein
MKHGLLLGMAPYVVCTALLLTQNQQTSIEQRVDAPIEKADEKRSSQPDSGTTHGPIDILSDTAGVDVHPYLDRVFPLIKGNWYERVPDSARPPISKKGKVSISFHILKDGQITDVLYANGSGDPLLDRAAFGSITESSPLPPLPSHFGCEYLAVRIRFYYNQPPDITNSNNFLVPCITSKIRVVGPVRITVSPASAQVFSGATQKFSAVITGEPNSGVNWKVSGSGCSASTCGSVSPEGLYTAPSSIPSPPSVIVTATLTTDPTEAATTTVTIVKPTTPR